MRDTYFFSGFPKHTRCLNDDDVDDGEEIVKLTNHQGASLNSNCPMNPNLSRADLLPCGRR